MKKRKFVLSALVAAVMSANMFTGVLATDTGIEAVPGISDVPIENQLDWREQAALDGFVLDGNDVLIKYTGPDGDVVIPDGVTSIGKSAFYRCSGLTSVTIPDSVTSIGEYAFNTSGLTSVTIPDGVTSIGKSAFYSCSKLTSVTIPDSVTSIGENAFKFCVKLTSVTIPGSVTSIGRAAFQYCWGLTSVTLSEGVTSIGEYAFEDCSELTSVTIPEGVTHIGYMAFNWCEKLETVNFPSTLETIGECAFRGAGLTNVDLSNTQVINARGFGGCSNLKTVKLNPNTVSIGAAGFASCTSLEEIVIPATVEEIGMMAFANTPREAIIYEDERSNEPINLTYKRQPVSNSVQKVTITSNVPTELFIFNIESDMAICDENGVPYENGEKFAESLIEAQTVLSEVVDSSKNLVSITGFQLSLSLAQRGSSDLLSFYVLGEGSPTFTLIPEFITESGIEQTSIQDATKTVYYPTSISEEKRQLLGDIDSSGAIEVDDALMIFKHIATIETIPDDAIVRADINANGEIEVNDALEILKHMAGVDSDYSNAIGSII